MNNDWFVLVPNTRNREVRRIHRLDNTIGKKDELLNIKDTMSFCLPGIFWFILFNVGYRIAIMNRETNLNSLFGDWIMWSLFLYKKIVRVIKQTHTYFYLKRILIFYVISVRSCYCEISSFKDPMWISCDRVWWVFTNY